MMCNLSRTRYWRLCRSYMRCRWRHRLLKNCRQGRGSSSDYHWLIEKFPQRKGSMKPDQLRSFVYRPDSSHMLRVR